MTDPQIQILYDAATIEKQVGALGQRLQTDYAGQDPLLVSILGGSVVFLADLLRAIQMPIRYETIKVQYSSSDGDDSLLEIDFPISLTVRDQSLIVLKDVVATGVTESYLTSQFQELGARDIRFVALIDLPEHRNSDISVDYQLFTPKKSGTFVGYGLKIDARYGNLPYLGRLLSD
jgi:hypoxanthine phosphoribosyltransferase